jgi:hypothetical protein
MIAPHDFIPTGKHLEVESQRQLSHTWTYRGAADNPESRRSEICIGIGKLRMVEHIEEFGAKFKGTPVAGPREPD